VDHLPAVTSTAADEVIAGFVPTRRFAHASFDSYKPDPRFPSQAHARDRLQAFAAAQPRSNKRGLARWLRRGDRPSEHNTSTPRAVYLDGGYGVGKTHLLAATYHAVSGPRLYLSFGELAYTIARLGVDETLEVMANTRLVCIDEFELDDVAQTRMATMFLRRLLTRPGEPVRIVTTSNTLPSDLGQGRFAAEAFTREIGEIAAYFEVLTIDGEDYRHRQWGELARGSSPLESESELVARYQSDPADDATRALVTWSDLADDLGRVHPIHYAQIAARLDGLYVSNLEGIADQAVALRLVHFVDKLYDGEVRVALTTAAGLALSDVFSTAYRHGGYEKKYRRCLSRLHELLAETSAAAGAWPAAFNRAPSG
jgi:cell division protein ZapE